MPEELYLGLMSGTSLDGADAALVAMDGQHFRLLYSHYQPYSGELRKALLALHDPGVNELDRAARLGNELSTFYADTVRALLQKSGTRPASVRALACHGQTIRHQPALGYTLQLFNPALLAELTGITVVADFRSRDIAAGGQGAPLVPAFHQAAFGHPDEVRVVANIGGIANLTILYPDGTVSGFDCGPGNALLDGWIERHTGARYDHNGDWAAQGKILDELYDRARQHPFFARSAPKSAGREDFNLSWLAGLLNGDEAPADVQRTLLELTAYGIASACQNLHLRQARLFLCGGGAHNAALRAALQAQLPDSILQLTDELGIAADWVEAVAFAWLGRQCVSGIAGNIPAVTGARGPRILGAIYPA